MSRKLKFRAIMLPYPQSGHGDKAFVYCNGISGNWSSIHGRYYGDVNPDTITQFTGLCDKNGKEIYEGDIVEFPFKTKHPVTKSNIVRWEGAGFAPLSIMTTGGFVPTVIGNIYENPELLKTIA